MKLFNSAWIRALVITLVAPLAASVANATSCQTGFSIQELLSVEPTRAAVRQLILSLSKSYECMDLVNHFAEKTGLPSDIVKNVVRSDYDGSSLVVFGNMFDQRLCGGIGYSVSAPNGSKALPPQLETLRLSLSQMVTSEFIAASGHISKEMEDWAEQYVPPGRSFPLPSGERVIGAIGELQKQLQRRTYEIIARQMPADQTFVQTSSVIGCTISKPEAIIPSSIALEKYPGAWSAYLALIRNLEVQVN